MFALGPIDALAADRSTSSFAAEASKSGVATEASTSSAATDTSNSSRASLAPIAFVPLDDRPVTYQLPIMLGAIAGQPLLTPPRAAIGNYLEPGDPDALLHWLEGYGTQGVSALVASTDMVAYGGLVASRVPGVSTSEAFARLRALAALKSERNLPFVGVFGTIMRLAPTGVPRLGLATNYYAAGQTVDDLQAYANLPDPPRGDDIARAHRLSERIGAPTLAAYLKTRARNRDVDQWALQLTAEGGFDQIVIGQDDAGPQGLHLKDVAALKRTARRFFLGNRAAIEPGADELGMVMLARVFARNARWQPTVAVVYSRPDGGATVDHLEYVPIDTTIGQIVEGCGARRIASATGGDSNGAEAKAKGSGAADITLYVRVAATSDSDEAAFEDRIARDAAAGHSVAVADLTFLHGGPGPEQQELTKALIARGDADKIDAFASWNTDANTIGTALPEAIAAGAGRRTGTYNRREHVEFLLDRYIDDYAFHQFVRPDLNEALRARGVDTSLLLAEDAREASDDNRAALWQYALDLLAQIFPDYRDAGLTITLPWDRTFETQIDVRMSRAAL
jgi:hypothetical protein